MVINIPYPIIIILILFLLYSNTYTKPYRNKFRYNPKWKTVSYAIRAANHWTCNRCKQNISKHKHLLHAHHKDGNSKNNNYSNLESLCIHCHALEPGGKHKDLQRTPEYQQYLQIYNT